MLRSVATWPFVTLLLLICALLWPLVSIMRLSIRTILLIRGREMEEGVDVEEKRSLVALRNILCLLDAGKCAHCGVGLTDTSVPSRFSTFVP